MNSVLDAAAVYEMLCELENKVLDRAAFEKIYGELIADTGHKILLCEEEGQVCGMLHFRMEYQLHHVGKIGEIMEFIVQERCRMGGIGGRMS